MCYTPLLIVLVPHPPSPHDTILLPRVHLTKTTLKHQRVQENRKIPGSLPTHTAILALPFNLPNLETANERAPGNQKSPKCQNRKNACGVLRVENWTRAVTKRSHRVFGYA